MGRPRHSYKVRFWIARRRYDVSCDYARADALSRWFVTQNVTHEIMTRFSDRSIHRFDKRSERTQRL